MQSQSPSRAFLAIAALGTIPLLILPFVRVAGADNYKYSSLFLVPILWATYAGRRKIHLHPFHYALFALALLLHNLGALGFYTKEFGGLAFDTYVHFYYGLVGGLAIERGFRQGLGWTGWRQWIAVPVFLLGLGAIHELVELASTLGLGKEMGMYKVGNADEYDTHKDLLNNLLGALLALGLSALYRRTRPRSDDRAAPITRGGP